MIFHDIYKLELKVGDVVKELSNGVVLKIYTVYGDLYRYNSQYTPYGLYNIDEQKLLSNVIWPGGTISAVKRLINSRIIRIIHI